MAIRGMQPVMERPLARGLLGDLRFFLLLQGTIRLRRMDALEVEDNGVDYCCSLAVRSAARATRDLQRGVRAGSGSGPQIVIARAIAAEDSGSTVVARSIARRRGILVVGPTQTLRIARPGTGSRRRCPSGARRILPMRSAEREARARTEHGG